MYCLIFPMYILGAYSSLSVLLVFPGSFHCVLDLELGLGYDLGETHSLCIV